MNPKAYACPCLCSKQTGLTPNLKMLFCDEDDPAPLVRITCNHCKQRVNHSGERGFCVLAAWNLLCTPLRPYVTRYL